MLSLSSLRSIIVTNSRSEWIRHCVSYSPAWLLLRLSHLQVSEQKGGMKPEKHVAKGQAVRMERKLYI